MISSCHLEYVGQQTKSGSEKKVTTVRLVPLTHASLKKAARTFDKSQSEIVEEALSDYFQKYNLLCRYQLHVTSDQIILMRLEETKDPRVVEVSARNGVPPHQLIVQYREKLKEPVDLIQEEGE